MPFRLGIVVLVIAAFGYGFSVLVDRTDGTPGGQGGCIPTADSGCADFTRR